MFKYLSFFPLILALSVLLPDKLTSQSINTYGHADNVIVRHYLSSVTNHHFLSLDSLYPKLDTTTTYYSNYGTTHHNNSSYYPGVYSDKAGELRLYTRTLYLDTSSGGGPSGTTALEIRNGNHLVIDTLAQNFLLSYYGMFWPVVLVPSPGNPDHVYVFKVTKDSNDAGSHVFDPQRIHWSLIDLSGNNGHGSVVFDSQVFSSDSLRWQAIALTKHTNGRDYWLVCKKFQPAEYVAYHIQPGGAVDTVYSVAGSQVAAYGHHVFKISPDGRWLADNTGNAMGSADTLQLLNFDASTGIVSDSNARYVLKYNVFDGIGAPVYTAFSPNSRYVYVLHFDYPGTWEQRLYQYNLNMPDQQSFFNSRVLVKNVLVTLPGAMQKTWWWLGTAANGKIYSFPLKGFPGWGYGLHSIESPNTAGIGSQPQDTIFLINAQPNYGHTDINSFHKFASSWLKEPLDFSYSHVCAGEGTPPTHFAFTDSVVDAFWSFGDTLAMGADTSNLFFPTYHYNQPGDYHVWAKALSYGMWDSISKVITIHPPAQVALGPDTVLTGNDSLVLDAGPDHISYNWSTGDSTRTITLYGNQLSPGDYMYHVEVTDTNGCTGTGSIMVTYEEDTTSIVQKAREPLWEAFPNPCEDNLHIKFPQSTAWGQANLRLYSPEGKLLQKWDIPAHTHRFTVDMSAYSSGIYWLELSTGDKVRREKIVKVNHP